MAFLRNETKKTIRVYEDFTNREWYYQSIHAFLQNKLYFLTYALVCYNKLRFLSSFFVEFYTFLQYMMPFVCASCLAVISVKSLRSIFCLFQDVIITAACSKIVWFLVSDFYVPDFVQTGLELQLLAKSAPVYILLMALLTTKHVCIMKGSSRN